MIIYITKTQECWATIEKIYEYVSKDGSGELSMSSLYRELKTLTEKEIILTRKDPKDKNRAVYAICTMNVGRNMELLHPSKIRDGIFDDEPVKVIHPISGKLEVIEI